MWLWSWLSCSAVLRAASPARHRVRALRGPKTSVLRACFGSGAGRNARKGGRAVICKSGPTGTSPKRVIRRKKGNGEGRLAVDSAASLLGGRELQHPHGVQAPVFEPWRLVQVLADPVQEFFLKLKKDY